MVDWKMVYILMGMESYFIMWMADHLKYNIRHCSMNPTSYDAGTYKNIDEICLLMKQLKPISENGARELWLKVPRGSIEDFGDYEEMLENGEVVNYDDFVRYWQDSYPNEYEWLSFGVVETEEGYKGIFLEHYLALESDPRRQKTIGKLDWYDALYVFFSRISLGDTPYCCFIRRENVL